ncbi:MAG: hypothetical protein WEB00_04450 [Dehalococcoidia bacterium]
MKQQSLGSFAQPLMVVGVVFLLFGLTWDAILHWADPDLASREGIFTLTNPGHVLFAGGIGLAVTGLLLQILFSNEPRWYRRVLPAAGLIALSMLSVGFGASSEGGLSGGGHSHDAPATVIHENGDEHTEAEHAAITSAEGQPAEGESVAAAAADHGHVGEVAQVAASGTETDGEGGDQNRHDGGHEVAISLEQNAVLQGQIEAARVATEKYRDIEVAKADGYVQITQMIPGLGMHMVNLNMGDVAFDPARPEQLLYETAADGSWALVGVAYSEPVVDENVTPDGFAGPLDTWHYHTNLCFGAWGVRLAEDEADCSRSAGFYVARTGWLCHFWLYKDSPEGMFSHENSLVG